MPFRLEAVITCVNYGDYLAETLPRIRPLFDKVVVVTNEVDRETAEIARRCSASYQCTDIMERDGQRFNKGAAINFGLGWLSNDTWVCHLDADTYLPPNSRQWFERKLKDHSCLYGVDRVNCVGWDRWQKFVQQPVLAHDYGCRVPVPHGFPLLDRIALEEHGGWMPIGYCQLWHRSSGRKYPGSFKEDAERGDVLFASQWSPHQRILIPEVIAVHLQAAPCALGANWKGRTTPRFVPPKS